MNSGLKKYLDLIIIVIIDSEIESQF